VVCYRAFNERSGHRFGTGVQGRPPAPNAENAQFAWYAPEGLLTPASWVAMFARRYMHVAGATGEDFGRVAVADRAFAATNPKAWFYGKPITLEDHQASRFIVDPLRLLDCCQESDGGQAIVVTTLERARDCASTPAVIQAAAQGSGAQQDMMTSYYRDDMTRLPEMGVVARQLWETSGLGPDDMQCAVLYDHFTPFVLNQLEELGFCAWGEAKEFLRDGHINPGGKLPTNTHGGQLGEAYIHGMNGIAEGVRQVRGTAVNQVDGVDHVVVTAGTGVPTSGLVLGADR
jgi:acetyl-CoA acetyltransferase